MKTKILLTLLTYFTFNPLWAQTYDPNDVAVLQSIDAACDGNSQLNWNK